MSFITRLLDALFENGGFSAYMTFGSLADKGYAVSLRKDLEQKFPLINPHATKRAQAFQAIGAYVVDHFTELAQRHNVLGAWLDADSVLWLDVSTIVQSFDEAIELARKHNQVAIYSYASKSVVYLEEVEQ